MSSLIWEGKFASWLSRLLYCMFVRLYVADRRTLSHHIECFRKGRKLNLLPLKLYSLFRQRIQSKPFKPSWFEDGISDVTVYPGYFDYIYFVLSWAKVMIETIWQFIQCILITFSICCPEQKWWYKRCNGLSGLFRSYPLCTVLSYGKLWYKRYDSLSSEFWSYALWDILTGFTCSIVKMHSLFACHFQAPERRCLRLLCPRWPSCSSSRWDFAASSDQPQVRFPVDGAN